MNLRRVLLVKIFLIALWAVQVESDAVVRNVQCPALEEPCMDEASLKMCNDLIASGCHDVQILESCPLQFSCNNYNSQHHSESEPDACVSLWVYDDDKCHGQPLRELSFPTWTTLGSPCYHDVTLGVISVADQYCNLDTGNWHESIFMYTKICEVRKPWWRMGQDNQIDLTFTTDGCIGGMQLQSCQAGPCSALSEELKQNNIDQNDLTSPRARLAHVTALLPTLKQGPFEAQA